MLAFTTSPMRSNVTRSKSEGRMTISESKMNKWLNAPTIRMVSAFCQKSVLKPGTKAEPMRGCAAAAAFARLRGSGTFSK